MYEYTQIETEVGKISGAKNTLISLGWEIEGHECFPRPDDKFLTSIRAVVFARRPLETPEDPLQVV